MDESQRACWHAWLDSLLIRSPRWAEDGAGHPAPTDKSLPRHPMPGPVRHRVTPGRDGRNHPHSRSQTSHPQTHSQPRRGLPGWACRNLHPREASTPTRTSTRRWSAQPTYTLVWDEPVILTSRQIVPDWRPWPSGGYRMSSTSRDWARRHPAGARAHGMTILGPRGDEEGCCHSKRDPELAVTVYVG